MNLPGSAEFTGRNVHKCQQNGLRPETRSPDFEFYSISAIDNARPDAYAEKNFSGKADPGDEAYCLCCKVSGLPFRADTVRE